MNDKYIPLGGGNGWAIMATGIPMFLFYLCGWSVVGTIFLILFLIAGFNSLFPHQSHRILPRAQKGAESQSRK